MAKITFVTKLLVRRLPDLPDCLLRLWAKNGLLCSNKILHSADNGVELMPIQCDVPMPAIFLLRFADAIIIVREGLAFFPPSFFSYQDGLLWHLRALHCKFQV